LTHWRGRSDTAIAASTLSQATAEIRPPAVTWCSIGLDTMDEPGAHRRMTWGAAGKPPVALRVSITSGESRTIVRQS